METQIHVKAGSTIFLDTKDLWADSKSGNHSTQVIKLSGVDDNGGKFNITLFGADEMQSIVAINNLDDTDFRINGSQINNDSFATIKKEKETA